MTRGRDLAIGTNPSNYKQVSCKDPSASKYFTQSMRIELSWLLVSGFSVHGLLTLWRDKFLVGIYGEHDCSLHGG